MEGHWLLRRRVGLGQTVVKLGVRAEGGQVLAGRDGAVRAKRKPLSSLIWGSDLAARRSLDITP